MESTMTHPQGSSVMMILISFLRICPKMGYIMVYPKWSTCWWSCFTLKLQFWELLRGVWCSDTEISYNLAVSTIFSRWDPHRSPISISCLLNELTTPSGLFVSFGGLNSVIFPLIICWWNIQLVLGWILSHQETEACTFCEAGRFIGALSLGVLAQFWEGCAASVEVGLCVYIDNIIYIYVYVCIYVYRTI